MTHVSFTDLPLSPPLLKAVAECGYAHATPIQAQAIPPLTKGRDLLGIAQTGTGKTAAFALPMLERLAQSSRRRPSLPRALVLTPTRELAAQVEQNIESYAQFLTVKSTVIFGGVGAQPQIERLRRGVDILVATPGRLLDLMGQGHLDLSQLEIFVLDEADRMLDMGFIHDVRRVIKALPVKRQSLLFSATMPKDIVELAERILNEPVRVEVTPPSTTVERIEQQVLFVEKSDKAKLLREILQDGAIERTLVFTRTKHGANRVAKSLVQANVTAEAIHGNKSQTARQRALGNFRSGETRVLVATDIAARGIDVPGVTHVINFDLPNVPEDYVHRIGRTARAGREGVALSFCDVEERAYLRDIERVTGQRVPIKNDHPFPSAVPMTTAPAPAHRPAPRNGSAPGPTGRRRRSRRGRGSPALSR